MHSAFCDKTGPDSLSRVPAPSKLVARWPTDSTSSKTKSQTHSRPHDRISWINILMMYVQISLSFADSRSSLFARFGPQSPAPERAASRIHSLRICSPVFCRSHKLQAVFNIQGVVKTSGINPALIEDIAVGTVLTPGGGANVARAASLIAGIPNTAGLNTVNRQCSSGLMAVVQIAHEIQSGMIDIGIGGGMESMTRNFGPGALGEVSDAVHEHHEAKDVLIPMGIMLVNATNRKELHQKMLLKNTTFLVELRMNSPPPLTKRRKRHKRRATLMPKFIPLQSNTPTLKPETSLPSRCLRTMAFEQAPQLKFLVN